MDRDKLDAIWGVARKRLGMCGRMLSATKSKPDVVYNGNVCTKKYGKIWFGDLDLKDKNTLEQLNVLSMLLKEDVYILREMDARFDNEENPNFDKAILVLKDKEIK